jgi:hypothetical protein
VPRWVALPHKVPSAAARDVEYVRLQERIAPVRQEGYGKLLQTRAAGKARLRSLQLLHIHSRESGRVVYRD